MKKALLIFILTVLAVLIPVGTVSGDTPPDDSQNVTIWQNGPWNVTNTQNGTLDISATDGIEVVGFEDIAADFLQFLIIAGITVLAFTGKRVFVRLIASPALIAYGLTYAIT